MTRFKYHVTNLKYALLFHLKYWFSDKKMDGSRQKVVVLDTPTHGNLGDQAIAYAQMKYLETNFPDAEYVEIYHEDVISYLKALKKALKPGDVVFFHGGGNMGNLYPSAEKIRRFAISKLSDTPIISFPQSVCFEDTYMGNHELEKSKNVYSRAPKWELVAREPITLELMKSYFPKNKILFTPDIVLYLAGKQTSSVEKNAFDKALVLLRNDKERAIGNEDNTSILSYLNEHFSQVTISDTHIGTDKYVDSVAREEKLQEKWGEYQAHDLIITDRLHGMIFAVITNRPCIVFENTNHKIASTYDHWLKDCPSIRLIKELSVDNLDQAIRELKENNQLNEPFQLPDSAFEPLTTDIQKCLEKSSSYV